MGIRSALRRPDWLAELQTALAVGMVIATAGVLLSAGTAAVGDSVTFAVPAGSVGGLADVRGSLRPNVAVDAGGLVDVAVAGPSAGQRVLSALTGLPSYVVGLVLLGLLWHTVRAARRTGPFSPVLARRLRLLGVVALAGGLIADVIETVATFLASETVFDGFLSASYAYSWWWLLLGLGFLAIAELIGRGATMRAELDEVV